MSINQGEGMEISCAICGSTIGDTWVEIIVRDTMGDDIIHKVGFVDTSTCLMRYAERVIKNEA